MTKVIHVQLMQGRKNYYFGSIPAIYSVLTAEEIGIKLCSLERVGLSKGGVVLNKKACIRAGELIRSKTTRQRVSRHQQGTLFWQQRLLHHLG